MKGQWRIMNKVINKGSAVRIIRKLKVDDAIIENQHEIADKFNSYFINTGPKLASSIHSDRTDMIPTSTTSEPPCYSYLSSVTRTEIIQVISKLKNSSPGIDNIIKAGVLKAVAEKEWNHWQDLGPLKLVNFPNH